MVPLLVVFLTLSGPPSWLQWGGPTRDFQVGGRGLHWKGTEPRRAWQRDLGDGFSAVIGDREVVFAAYRRGDSMVVARLDARTGGELWERLLVSVPFPGRDWFLNYGQGPRTTPLLHGGRLFVATFTGELVALDPVSGRTLWSRELWKELGGTFRNVGYSNSPLAFGDTLIVPVGGAGQGLLALRQSDGKTVWASSDFRNAMSSPILIHLDGEPQVVAFMVEGVAGFDLRTGRQLWFHPHTTLYSVNASTPVWHARSRTLVVASGYDTGARGIRLSRAGERTVAAEAWASRRLRVQHGNMLLLGDHVFGSSGDSGVAPLTALHVETGEVAWQDRRFPKSTLVQAGDRTLVLDEDGRLAIARLSPSGLDVLQEAQVTTRLSWTAPTLIGTRLYVRDRTTLVALDLEEEPGR